MPEPCGGTERMKGMTLHEFEASYAARSGLAVAELHGYGLHGAPCDCDYEGCEGWQMVGARPPARTGSQPAMAIASDDTPGEARGL